MRYIGFVKALILSLCVVLVFGRCSEEQEYAEVGFSALNISWAEDDSLGNVSLKLTGADPVLLPVVVDVEFEPVDVNGNLDEIEYDKIDKTRGMDIIFVTTAKTDEEARELLRLFNMPFAK